MTTIETPALDEDRDVLADAARDAADVESLRPGQREAVEAVLVRDTIAVLATGTGKTAIYETAGYLLDGPTLVISPTIALQRDQVQTLREHGHPTASISSARSERTRREALEAFAAGQIEMLLLAPEQLGNAEVLEEIGKCPPSLVVVDEAHCVSEWGHTFRPDYLLIGSVVERFHHPRVLALTATAAPRVRRDIAQRLGMRDPAIIVGNADRPEIWLGARLFAGNRERDQALVETAVGVEGAVIVYAPTRRRCSDLAAALADAGRHRLAGLALAARDDHAGAHAGHGLGDGAPDAAARTGHDGDLAGQVEGGAHALSRFVISRAWFSLAI